MNGLRRLFVAISCVTSFPVGTSFKNQSDIGGLSVYLPTVGLLIGATLASIAIGLHQIMAPPLVTGVMLTIAWIAISGGLHFDGLMDAADGIFSHRSRERMLEIMHDSRVGNFGVMTGVAAFAAKVSCLATFGIENIVALLIVIPCWSRWCETFTIGFFPYCREEGLGKIWHDTTRPRDLLLSSIVPIAASAACAFFLGWSATLMACVFAIATGLIAAFYINSILAGHTGDTYGAVVELSEAGALLLTAIMLPSLHV